MKKINIALLLVVCIVAMSAKQQGKWIKLFDGKSYAGWHNFNKTGPVSELWGIEDGAMVLLGKGGGDLVTDNEFQNFELELDWKISEKGTRR